MELIREPIPLNHFLKRGGIMRSPLVDENLLGQIPIPHGWTFHQQPKNQGIQSLLFCFESKKHRIGISLGMKQIPYRIGNFRPHFFQNRGILVDLMRCANAIRLGMIRKNRHNCDEN